MLLDVAGGGKKIEFLQKSQTMTFSNGMVALAKHLVAIWQIDKNEGTNWTEIEWQRTELMILGMQNRLIGWLAREMGPRRRSRRRSCALIRLC